MSLESYTGKITDLVVTNPTPTDPKSQGDDHLRGIKYTLQQTFPGYDGPINATRVPFTPAAGIVATNTQAAIEEVANKAPLSAGKNVIINGAFNVNQRGYASGVATTAGQYTLDRWKVTATTGITFINSANKVTVTIPPGQTIQQVVEGLNLQTGTYALSWEGTAQGKIGAGPYGASGITASITGGTNTTIEFGPGTVANIQLEIGSIATPFEHRPIGTELALCQRYYYRTSGAAANQVLSPGAGATGSTVAVGTNPFPTTMRSAPIAVEQSGAAGDYAVYVSGVGVTCSSVPTFNSASKDAATTAFTVASGLSTGQGGWIRTTGTAGYLGWSAEL